MLAAQLTRFGRPVEGLRVVDVPRPQAARGQLLVEMLAAPINPADLTVSSAVGERTAFTNASGLEAIDTFVISGRYDLTKVQSEALRSWVTLGGHLILSVGKDLEAYQNSPLADWVSGASGDEGPETFRLTGPTSFLRLDALESYAGKDSDQILIDWQKPVAGVKIEPGNSAETILLVLSGPLIVRAPYGMGTVTFLGLSLSDEPIRSWPSLPKALRQLLWDTRPVATGGTAAAAKQLAYSGISEFATQVQTALVTFPSVKRLSTWAVIGLLTVYLLVIGPVDYLLVHHLLRRPRLTWLTLPVLVAGTAFLAAWMAKSQNGEQLMVSQVDVLDYDESTRTMRSRSWASLYSPETRRYGVSLKPAALAGTSIENSDAPDVRMSWFGTPESSFGGMYREGGQQIQPPQYQFSTKASSIENLPIPIWGSKSITGEWCRQGAVWVESDLESPRERERQLRGTIRHNFPVPLTDWFVAYKTRVFLPRVNPATGEADPLAPGKEWPPNDPTWDRVNQREIGGYLTRTVAKQFHQSEESGPAIFREQQPYDPLAPANPDPLGDIFRILSFHQMVGGKQYSGLDNHFFRGMDLSDRLGLNQAVLFGRLDLPAAELQIEDHTPQQNLRATFVRIVLPVRKNHADN